MGLGRAAAPGCKWVLSPMTQGARSIKTHLRIVKTTKMGAPAMIPGLEPLCCDKQLGELGLFSLGKRRLWGDLTAAFQNLKGASEKAGDRLSSRACCARTKGNGCKPK